MKLFYSFTAFYFKHSTAITLLRYKLSIPLVIQTALRSLAEAAIPLARLLAPVWISQNNTCIALTESYTRSMDCGSGAPFTVQTFLGSLQSIGKSSRWNGVLLEITKQSKAGSPSISNAKLKSLCNIPSINISMHAKLRHHVHRLWETSRHPNHSHPHTGGIRELFERESNRCSVVDRYWLLLNLLVNPPSDCLAAMHTHTWQWR